MGQQCNNIMDEKIKQPYFMKKLLVIIGNLLLRIFFVGEDPCNRDKTN